MKYYVLFNPHAGNHSSEEETKKLSELLPDWELEFRDMTNLKGYTDFFDEVGSDCPVILSGGDGTLNRFINDTDGMGVKNDIFYFATGSGNDFLHDIGHEKGAKPVCINKYIKDLPTVTVNGKTYRFLNGVGYGIDGYCCEVGDELRKIPGKKINYTAIAIKGLLFHYKPTNTVITVDGVSHSYKKVWLAPTMNGRFYGGGMMPTPNQDRLSEDGRVSTLVFHGSGKIKSLIVFPSLFKGEHIKHSEMCEVLSGREITVEFDRPTAVQIDGETIPGVTKYSVSTRVPVAAR